MNELSSALRDLAGEVSAPHPADAADLWHRGRTRVRRRVFAAAGVVAVLAVAVGTGTFAVAPVEVVPAGTQQAPGVPKNVWAPKGWYPGTKGDPPGALAVMGGLGRDGGNGLFGVSAATGEYRLLDLPDRADLGAGETAALSPDGRHVAYWLTGKPSGTAYPDEGSDLPIGVGVYDTIDGTVARYLPETEHGLSADDLVWWDEDVLLLTYGQRTSDTSANRITTYSWRPVTDSVPGGVEEPTKIPSRDPLVAFDPMPSRSGGLLVAIDARRFGFLAADGSVGREVVLTLPPLRAASYDAASVSRDHVVVRVHGDDGDDTFQTGKLGAGGVVERLDPLVGFGAQRFVGWLADDRFLVLGSNDTAYADLNEVDLGPQGVVAKVGTAEGGEWTPGLSFATDLLTLPMVDGVRPPQIDPRWRWTGIAVGAVVLLGLAWPLVLRRRRG